MPVAGMGLRARPPPAALRKAPPQAEPWQTRTAKKGERPDQGFRVGSSPFLWSGVRQKATPMQSAKLVRQQSARRAGAAASLRLPFPCGPQRALVGRRSARSPWRAPPGAGHHTPAAAALRDIRLGRLLAPGETRRLQEAPGLGGAGGARRTVSCGKDATLPQAELRRMFLLKNSEWQKQHGTNRDYDPRPLTTLHRTVGRRWQQLLHSEKQFIICNILLTLLSGFT